ncbi:MAG: hypothetical protein A3E85_00695 [Gammaproteobacteria bacterium RIFCSPHIGHO2_12_FULL_45_12]|nr:MAG: hypothetical protein A3E85_00695 [Gammaproteobacteria bacterium RIFCSPHIGHO2_12_FULL_45_12]
MLIIIFFIVVSLQLSAGVAIYIFSIHCLSTKGRSTIVREKNVFGYLGIVPIAKIGYLVVGIHFRAAPSAMTHSHVVASTPGIFFSMNFGQCRALFAVIHQIKFHFLYSKGYQLTEPLSQF